MSDSLQGKVVGLLHVAGKRRWLALGVAAASFIAFAIAAQKAPERYEASARVFVDTQTVLKPLMAGLTFQPDIDQQVKMLARTLVSRENVEKLMAMPEMHLATATPRAHEALAAKLMDQIQVAPTSSLNLFDITYKGADPGDARRIVQAMVDMFVGSGMSTRKHDSQEAEQFIDRQIKAYEGMLNASEARLKDFKLRQFGMSGVPAQDYFARVSSMTDELDKLTAELGSAERQRDAYRRQLDGAALSGSSQAPAPATGVGSSAEIEQRLDAQRRQLDDMLRRFTEEHPDVVGTRRMISQLESDLARRRAEESRGGTLPSVAQLSLGGATYQQLRLSLAAAESQAEGLRFKVASLQGRLAQARAEAGRVPEVEAELAQLNRDYDVIRKNYDSMVVRRESALLGAKLDESSQLAEFRVIDPARVSPTPAFPGRMHLTAIGALLAVALGLLAALAGELLHPTVPDMSTLRTLAGRPVIGSVSLITTPRMLQQQRRGTLRFGAASAALVASQALWIVWIALKPTLG